MTGKYKCVNPQCLVVADASVENRYCGYCGALLEEIKEEEN